MMNAFILYLYVVAGLATFLAIKRYLVIFLKFLLRPSGRVHDFLSRYILLPFLLRRRRLWGPMTRLRGSLHAMQLAATIACNVIAMQDLNQARDRAGSLATLHIALLAVFPQVSVGAVFLNVSLRTYRQLNASLGVMAVLQGLLHVILALQVTSFDLNVTL